MVDITTLSDSKVLLSRLQRGQAWLTQEWIALKGLRGFPPSERAEIFGNMLNLWDNLERIWRGAGGQGCIFGEARICDALGPVVCDACVDRVKESQTS